MSQHEMLVTINGPLTADVLVDAHLKALEAGARLVVEHDGAPTVVALRTAERFGIELRPVGIIVAHDEPAPEVVHSDDVMPWGSGPIEGMDPAPSHVEPIELIAFPWYANAEPSEDHHEVSVGQRARRGLAEHPTSAPNWNLPWKPGAPSTEALALNDPRIWRGQERMQVIRSDLEKTGVPSFGAIKRPELG